MTARTQPGKPGRRLQIESLVEAYLLTCQAEGKSENTLRWYGQKLQGFLDYLQAEDFPEDASSITPEVLRGLVAHLQSTGVSAFTTRV